MEVDTVREVTIRAGKEYEEFFRRKDKITMQALVSINISYNKSSINII